MARSDRNWFLHLTLLMLLILSIIPFLVTLNLSVKSIAQFEHERWEISCPFQWINYREAWILVKQYILNSVVVSLFSALGVIVLSSLGGYAFARGSFPLKEFLFVFILSGLMIPGILYLVPKFVVYRELGLINRRWALLISYWTEGQILGVFLFRSHIESLPNGLFEAAKMDGASTWDCFRHIVLPLSKPIISTLAVINVLWTWNDIVWPWIAITDDKLRTISVGLSIFQQTSIENWGPLFAGFTIAAAPLILLFVFTSRHFIEGLTSGAFKA